MALTDGDREIIAEQEADARDMVSRCRACGAVTEGLDSLTDAWGDCLDCEATAEIVEAELERLGVI